MTLNKLIRVNESAVVISIAHWAEIYGWPQRWVALNETTHPEGTK